MEKIFSEILDSARREAGSAVRVAKKVAEREVEYAKREADDLCERYKSENASELRAQREKLSVVRVRDKKKRELDQRQAFVEEILAGALDAFRREGRQGKLLESYRAFLKARFEKAEACFGKEICLVCPKEDEEYLRSLAQRLDLKKVESGDMSGGFVMSDPEGRISVDCTLEATIRNNEEKWRDMIMRGLEE